MPHAFHTRLTDAQAAAIDAVATFTDPTTGLLLSVSRQDVVHSILNQWMAQHAAAAPGRTALAATDEGARTVREETIQTIADSAGLPDPVAEGLTPERPAPASTVPAQPEPPVADLAPATPADPPAPVPPGSVYPVPQAAPSPPDALPDRVQGKAALASRVRALRQTMSHARIAKMLNDEGVPTLTGQGQWSNGSVSRLEKFGVQAGG